jgi:hypothetical protein
VWSLVPGEDSSTGNVMGGRKLARYVLEAVVGRCEAVEYGLSFLGARRENMPSIADFAGRGSSWP